MNSFWIKHGIVNNLEKKDQSQKTVIVTDKVYIYLLLLSNKINTKIIFSNILKRKNMDSKNLKKLRI